MSKRKDRRLKGLAAAAPRCRNRWRVALVWASALSLLAAVAVGVVRRAKVDGAAGRPSAVALPAQSSAFSPASPSKEYVYAGGRLVATEEQRPATPATPTNLRTSAGMFLLWNDNSDNETGFKIERQQGAGVWQQIGTADPNATGFKTTLYHYAYRVRATNDAGDSAPSNVAQQPIFWIYLKSYFNASEEFSSTRNPSDTWS